MRPVFILASLSCTVFADVRVYVFKPGVHDLGYFLGDIKEFIFENFTIEEKTVLQAEQAQFDFAEGAGETFSFEGAR